MAQWGIAMTWWHPIWTPPTPEEMERFLKDTSTNTDAKVFDKLQASLRYVER
jgi:hypothetical protein